jgi:hypothetical protein
MGRSTNDKLKALAAQQLAELITELYATSPVVREAVKLALATGQSPAKLFAEIDKCIRTIAHSKSFIDRDRRKPWSRNSTTCGPPLPAHSPH